MVKWSIRNGQRARVKRPGTTEYKHDYDNKNKQFFAKRTKPGCLNCGSTEVRAVGGNGRIIVYCAHCNKQLKVLNTKPTKVGDWSKQHIYRSRAGLCTTCGGTHYVGKMHLSKDAKHYCLSLQCTKCHASITWHNL